MATHPDYYAVLGVPNEASSEEIRKAYKKLAKKHHPDANTDDPSALEKFKQVQDAWAVLGDDTKRANFDKYGTPDAPSFRGGTPGDGVRWRSAGSGDEVPFDIEELLGGFRGGRAGGGQYGERSDWPIRGQDVQASIEVPFMLVAEGGKYDVRFQRDPGSSPESLSVTIPAGVDSGSVIRLSGQGTPGFNGGAAGDLFVSLNVTKHPWFRREAANVLLDVPISLAECGLGAKVDIPTISDGMITLTIPPGTNSGMKLRLRGKGIRDRRTGERGDMFAVVKVVSPKVIDDRTRELLEELKSIEKSHCREGLWQ